MKKILIAGNWKMHKTTAEAVAFADDFIALKPSRPQEAAVIAPFTQLEALKKAFEGSGIKVGAQNVCHEEQGAFTGEISVAMLKEIGVDLCVVGHSERRIYFGETDERINKKLKLLMANGIGPILCVGESLETREDGKEKSFVAGQLKADLAGIDPEDMEKIVVAYEPIWAIGTGKTATPEQAQEMCEEIRKIISEIFDEKTAAEVIIQYGGSVKPQNVAEILAMNDINGALVGGASLDPGSFYDIVEAPYSA